MLLCRRWGIRCLSCSRRSSRLSWSLCRLSKCPRSFLTEFLSVLWSVVLRRRRKQLVEVPTIISYSSLQRTVEQTIDIPVPHDRCGRGGGGGLQGFSPGQGSTAYSGADFVDIPVPGRGGRNVGLQGFPPRQSSTAHLASHERSSERIVEQIVEISVSRGFGEAFKIFAQDRVQPHLRTF